MKPQDEGSLREALCRAYVRLDRLGLIFLAAGNISVRFNSGMLISPAGASAETITPEMFVKVELDGSCRSAGKPSSEWAMHAAIYKAWPTAQAVVHTHSDHCVAMAATGASLPSFHYMVASFGGTDVPCIPYVTFGSPELGHAAAQCLTSRNACLLGNHGMICHASTLDRAVGAAMRLEVLCRQYIAARQAGNVQLLSDHDMRVALKRYETYGIY
jgi:L-fuculose-phosphate aldolase